MAAGRGRSSFVGRRILVGRSGIIYWFNHLLHELVQSVGYLISLICDQERSGGGLNECAHFYISEDVRNISFYRLSCVMSSIKRIGMVYVISL